MQENTIDENKKNPDDKPSVEGIEWLESAKADMEDYLEEQEGVSYGGDEARRPYPMCLMVNWNDIGVFVEESGGWKEFDYVA